MLDNLRLFFAKFLTVFHEIVSALIILNKYIVCDKLHWSCISVIRKIFRFSLPSYNSKINDLGITIYDVNNSIFISNVSKWGIFISHEII